MSSNSQLATDATMLLQTPSRLATMLCFALLIALSAGAYPAPPEPQPVLLAIDAEFGVKASTSAQAIQAGAEVAADEINAAGGVLDGRPLKVIVRNNNSVPARAAENLRELASDPNVAAIMGGKYSPTYQQLAPLIHEIGIVHLNPWAAADDITVHPDGPNYIFRLSTTDSWALTTIVRSAAQRGYRRLGILLPNTGWGRSSLVAARKAVTLAEFRSKPVQLVAEQWFNFGDPQFKSQYDVLRKAGADAIILVANEGEGAALIREIASRAPAERLPVLSHWGVTGGHFFAMAREHLRAVDFSVVQTYSFIDARNPVAVRVAAAAQKKLGVGDARQIPSPVGVAHAYDLTHLLARAINRAKGLDRAAIRAALETLPEYRGLIRHYRPPFSPTRHEALDGSQTFMARYGPDGAIERIR